MKNIIFLAGVFISLIILFALRYQFNLIGDVGFRIAALLMFISVLIIRSIAKISFFSN